MKFQLLRVNSGKLIGLILVCGVSGTLAVGALSMLDEYSSFLSAGVATILFFGGGWVFNRCLLATQEVVCVTVAADELVEVNQQTGQLRRWLFAEITAYQRLPQARGTATLRLTLRQGRIARLSASQGWNFTTKADADSLTQFEQMVQAFEQAWHDYQQP